MTHLISIHALVAEKILDQWPDYLDLEGDDLEMVNSQIDNWLEPIFESLDQYPSHVRARAEATFNELLGVEFEERRSVIMWPEEHQTDAEYEEDLNAED